MEEIPKINLEKEKLMGLHKIEFSDSDGGPPKPEPDTPGAQNEEPKKLVKKLRIPQPRFNFISKKLLFRFSLVFVILIGIVGIFIALPAIGVYNDGKDLKAKAEILKNSVAMQDIAIVKSELNNFEASLLKFQSSYGKLAWTRGLPFVGAYYRDGDSGLKAGVLGIEATKLVIDAVEPYADIIGLAGENSQSAKDGEETANDRIDFLIQTVEQIAPKMDDISAKALAAKTELDTIDPERYPEEIQGFKVKENLKLIIDTADEAVSFIVGSKPLMQQAAYFLGTDETRRYLMLFQNDKELRPTGGFITAYTIMEVTSGKLNPVASSDIYSLDNNYTPNIKAPDPIVKLIKGPYVLSPNYRLRDMNWSPDFKESMDLFSKEAKKAGISDIDGIIAVDTQVVVNILNVLGTIGVPGFGNFNTDNDPRCDCPQVIYELERFADVEGPVVWSENEPGKIVFAPANYDNRKKIVGPLMNSVLSNALGQPKDKLPDLFEAAWKSISEKHVLLYMFDEEAQRAVEEFGLAGRIKDFEGDYLHVNDSNLGGRKSNLYVTNEVTQEIVKEGDALVKTVTIIYKNPQDYDGWLNSVLPNWTRVYVPKGSELIASEGFDEEVEVYEDLGKTVFAGGFELRPQGVKQIVLKYKLPIKSGGELSILVQKQPGLDKPLYSFKVGKSAQELFLKSDKVFKFKI